MEKAIIGKSETEVFDIFTFYSNMQIENENDNIYYMSLLFSEYKIIKDKFIECMPIYIPTVINELIIKFLL